MSKVFRKSFKKTNVIRDIAYLKDCPFSKSNISIYGRIIFVISGTTPETETTTTPTTTSLKPTTEDIEGYYYFPEFVIRN